MLAALKAAYARGIGALGATIIGLTVPLYAHANNAATTGTVAGPVISQTLLDLPSNTVVDLGQFSPTIPYGEYLDETRQVVSFSGMLYDRQRSQMVFFGGGHLASNYDSIWTLSLSDLTQHELYPPTPAQPTMTYANWDSVLGAWLSGPDSGPYPRPAARHTVDLMTMVGDELTSYAVEPGNARNTQQELINVANGITSGNDKIFASKSKIWHHNFVTNLWSYDPTNLTDAWTGMGGGQWGATEYDPVSGLVIQLDQSGLHTYDPVMHAQSDVILRWNSVSGSTHMVDENGVPVENTLGYNASFTYCPVDQKFYWFNNVAEVWRLDVDRANFANTKIVKLATTGTPPPLPKNAEHPVRFDTVNEVFGSGPFANRFYVFDPVTKAWSSQKVLGGTPGSVAFNSHVMDYSPEANVFIFMTDHNATPKSHIWAYRYMEAQ